MLTKRQREILTIMDLKAWDRLREEMVKKGFLLRYEISLDGDEARKALSPTTEAKEA